jgi:hypothetical protein
MFCLSLLFKTPRRSELHQGSSADRSYDALAHGYGNGSNRRSGDCGSDCADCCCCGGARVRVGDGRCALGCVPQQQVQTMLKRQVSQRLVLSWFSLRSRLRTLQCVEGPCSTREHYPD